MAQLKEHMLHDIADTVFSRQRAPNRLSPPASCYITQFFLSGKGPARVFRQVVGTGVTIGDRSYYDVFKLEYRNNPFDVPVCLMKLCLKWSRKLSVSMYEWCGGLTTNSEILCANRDMKEVIFHHPPPNNNFIDILEMFPNLVSVTLSVHHFAEMVFQSPKELSLLREVMFTSFNCVYDYKTLAQYSNKIPSLEVVRYKKFWSFADEFPEAGFTISTVKHVSIVLNEIDDLRQSIFNIPWTAMHKFYPSLRSVHVTINAKTFGRTLKISDYETFYQNFYALSLDFPITIDYSVKLSFNLQNLDELFELIAAKGDVYETPDCFKVVTLLPGKTLVYELSFKL